MNKGMSKFEKKKHFVGIDISKDTLDLCIIKGESPGKYNDLRIKNALTDFGRVTKWINNHRVNIGDCLFCMEHTGTYGLLLFAWLNSQGIDFCVKPGLEIKRSLGMTRGNSDRVSARRIAEYASEKRGKLTSFEMPSKLLIQIKQLLTYRDQMVRIKTALMNSRQSHQEYEQVSDLVDISQKLNMQIRQMQDVVADTEKKIKALIKSDPQVQKNFTLASSVKGIGLVIAAFMLVTTNNFNSFSSGRKYACYAGVAPFEHSSGTSVKGQTKVSHLGNKTIKTLLSNGANSAASWDKELRAYYERKLAEGKKHNVIMNAIKCKLINRVFATIKRQTPFVDIYQHNFAINNLQTS